jgi:hypothetical protein
VGSLETGNPQQNFIADEKVVSLLSSIQIFQLPPLSNLFGKSFTF